MIAKFSVSNGETSDFSTISTLIQLYPSLELLARYCVYRLHVPSWNGQEDDIAADIVQETYKRMIEYICKVRRGEAKPIRSLMYMMHTIAWNYCRDLRRREHRLLHIQEDALTQSTDGQTNCFEVSIENVYQATLFRLIACEVVCFPNKQRKALLIDLANRMHFGILPTPLQAAFLDVGIDLREYQLPLPIDIRHRSRHTALVNWAYKRVADLPQIQKYINDSDA